MSDLISRTDAIKDVETWTTVDEHERHLQKNVIEWLKEFPSAELSTNLAEVGTDAISRRSAIDAIRAMQTYKLFAGDDMLLIDQAGAQTELMLLPPIQPKRGRWINGHCSECNEHAPYWCMASTYHASNFCPNCGADMREVTT